MILLWQNQVVMKLLWQSQWKVDGDILSRADLHDAVGNQLASGNIHSIYRVTAGDDPITLIMRGRSTGPLPSAFPWEQLAPKRPVTLWNRPLFQDIPMMVFVLKRVWRLVHVLLGMTHVAF